MILTENLPREASQETIATFVAALNNQLHIHGAHAIVTDHKLIVDVPNLSAQEGFSLGMITGAAWAYAEIYSPV